MIQTKLRVGTPTNLTAKEPAIVVPVQVPDLEEIRKLANQLHARNREFEDELWGWPVRYDPELAEAPLDSQMTYTPAMFWIGAWPIWYVSFTWEHGRDQEPSVLIGQENLV